VDGERPESGPTLLPRGDSAGVAARMKVQTLVVKVASRCNLNCSYCYVYNQGDYTWQSQPHVMPSAVVSALITRVRAHCLRHGLKHFGLVLHGGEPLLCGEAFFRSFVQEARGQLLPEIQPHFFVQTNGTLLTAQWCRLLLELQIAVGVSLDGTPAANDRHRVDHAGRGSYRAARAGIEVFRSVAGRPPGLLSVIDPRTDPIACYEHFRDLQARSVDFLFPEATHERPPVPLGDWLIQVFDRWFHESPQTMTIRIFREIMTVLCGGQAVTELAGTQRSELLVVDCDGSIEPIDALKVCGHGFTKVGASVLSDELDDALATTLARQYQLAGSSLCGTCRACQLAPVCGGGQFAHRYSHARAFDNPSVYCHDLMKLITHIQSALCGALPSSLRERLGLGRVSYREVRKSLSGARPRLSLPVLRTD
jgi:uncharacterized protein